MYKRQGAGGGEARARTESGADMSFDRAALARAIAAHGTVCLLYTSDAADDLPCVDLGGRRIIKKKTYRSTH